jgi:hypothetical protein
VPNVPGAEPRIQSDTRDGPGPGCSLIGEELGLYRAMQDGQAISPEKLATRTGTNPRLVREWLSAQAAAGYVEHAEGKFRLPAEQAMALADEDSPVFVAGGAGVLASLFIDKDKLLRAFRGDGALSWGDDDPCLFRGTERFLLVETFAGDRLEDNLNPVGRQVEVAGWGARGGRGWRWRPRCR